MKHERMHGLEKIQVELAALVGLAAVYFWIGPSLRPADPLAPLTFLPEGDWLRAGDFLLVLGALAAFSAVVTIASRRAGAIVAMLAGAAGASCLSPRMHALLWLRQGELPRLYAALIAETVLLWVGLAVAIVVIDIVRGFLSRAFPQWAWKDPLAAITDEDRKRVADAAADAPPPLWAHSFIDSMLVYFARKGSGRVGAYGEGTARELRQSAASAGMGLVLSMVLLFVFLRGTDRGQVLFALACSFGLGTLIANQTFPTPRIAVAWVPPAIGAVFCYALAAVAPAHPPPTQSWVSVSLLARPLPIDWLCAGAGGAVLGLWVSCRLHESRLLEKHESAAEQKSAR